MTEQFWINYVSNGRNLKSATYNEENSALRQAFDLEMRQKASVINVESSSGKIIDKDTSLKLAKERNLSE